MAVPRKGSGWDYGRRTRPVYVAGENKPPPSPQLNKPKLA